MVARIFLAAVFISAVLSPGCNWWFDHAQQMAEFGPDRIAIDTVQGPGATWMPGKSYDVRGRYRLRTRESAILAAFVPTIPKKRSLPVVSVQEVMAVRKGEGQFQLAFHIPDDFPLCPECIPEVSLNTTSGKPFLTMFLGETKPAVR